MTDTLKGTITDRDRLRCPERGCVCVTPSNLGKFCFFWSSVLKISSKTYENFKKIIYHPILWNSHILRRKIESVSFKSRFFGLSYPPLSNAHKYRKNRGQRSKVIEYLSIEPMESYRVLTLKSRRHFSLQSEEASHQNRHYGPSVYSYYGLKKLPCFSGGDIEDHLVVLSGLIKDEKMVILI